MEEDRVVVADVVGDERIGDGNSGVGRFHRGHTRVGKLQRERVLERVKRRFFRMLLM